MKYLLNFNEGVEMNNKMWRRTTLSHYYKHEIQNFNMRDLEELSMYFNENQPIIDYGLNYNKMKLGTKFGLPYILNNHADLDNYKLLNEDNSFVFAYKLYAQDKDYTHHKVSTNICDKLVLITKNTDDYFLVLDRSRFLFKDLIDVYICDDLEGLIEFLKHYFSNKHPLNGSGKQKFYIENGL